MDDTHSGTRKGASQQTLNRSYPATAPSLAAIRNDVTDYARAAGLSGEELDNVKLAVSEAATNVVRHAYRERPGLVHIIASAVDGDLWVFVEDDGVGFNTATENPGMGLGFVVITNVSEQFTLSDRSNGGTEARIRFRLPSATGRTRPAGH